MNKRETYEQGATLTFELVGRFRIFGSGRPEFWFPPKGISFLLASLADVGKNLARNDAALELLAQLMKETERRKLDDYPTAVMLAAALQHCGIPVKYVSFEELGLKGKLIPIVFSEGAKGAKA